MYCINIDELKVALIYFQNEASVKGLILFGADKNRATTEIVEEALMANAKPLLGGFFPEIIADGERKEEGFVVIPIYQNLDVCIVETKQEQPIANQLSSWINEKEREIQSVFCFVNALWNEKTNFIHLLYDEFGPFVNYLGGGAGSLSFKSFPCVFCNQKVYENAAVIGTIQTSMNMGVAHGWQPISELIKVTETKGNTLVSLNWNPAFDVYSSLIEAHSKQKINQENFFDVAKSYPFGLVRLDEEMIIRDPYAAENGMIHIVDEVPEGQYIRVMHGNMPSLLDGARQAVAKLNETTNDKTLLCIDCISRVLYMNGDFSSELKILNTLQKINGVLSIGEIANSGDSSLALYNKTIVVSQWVTVN